MSKKSLSVKTVSILLVLVLLVGLAAGGTVAWLIDETPAVVNTFTYGDVNITLTESDTGDGDNNPNTNKYEMIPGSDLAKNPTVTVKANSVDSWLFVKLVKSANFDAFMEYAVEDGWIALAGVDGVYYRAVAKDAANDQAFSVLKDDKVTVKTSVTKEMVNALDNSGANTTNPTYPTLTVVAYAVQKDNIDSAAVAWGYASGATTAADDAAMDAAISSGQPVLLTDAGIYTLPSVSNGNVSVTGTEDTVISIPSAFAMSGTDLNLTGVTINTPGGGFNKGIQHVDTETYTDCVIEGSISLYGNKTVFNNCTFDLVGVNDYIWTYGSKEVEFNNCTFNTSGKAILIYNEGTVGSSTVTVNNCQFYANGKAYAGGFTQQQCAAVEIDSSLIPGTYTVNFTGTNVVDPNGNFCGLVRIKKNQDPSNVTINGATAVTTING